MSGTVVNTRKWCSLRGMFEIQENKSKKRIKASWPPPAEHEPLVELGSEPAPMLYDIPASELQNVLEYHENDLVIYKNWIGRIRDVHDEVTVRLFDNSVVVVHDEVELEPLNSSHDRFTPGDLVKTKKANLRTGRWIYGAYNPNVSPVGVVVYVRTIQAEVDWQQSRIGATNVQDHPGFVLDLDDLESGNVHVYDRTRRPKGYARLAESHEQHIPPVPSEYVSPQTVSFPELEVSPGQRVKFRDLTGACVKYDGSNTHGKLTKQERQDNCGYDMNIFTIASYSTEVVVQWQDCSITTECSTSLVPDAGVDDEDAVYPGELVCTNETTESESWIVRPRKVGVVGSVNAEDRMAAVRWFPHASVAFMKDLGMDLLPESHVGSLPVPTPTNQVSLYDVHAPISLNVRRGDFVFLLKPFVTTSKAKAVVTYAPILPGALIGLRNFTGSTRSPRCPQDAKIIALRDHEADEWDNGQDAMSYDYDESDGDDYGSGDSFDDEIGEQWYEYENGVIRAEDEDEDEAWSTESERVENDNDRMDIEPAQPAETFAAPPSETESTVARPGKPASDAPVKATASNSLHPSSLPDAPPSYTILDTAVPSDHHFATTQATTAPRHIKASQKEHKILATSSAIPDGVYVRSYESRMDLFRVLVVGPIDTPYEYAPFVFDIYLPPLYPFEPPQAFS
ncbi:hypothetical protein H2203_000338 [Taxawa tesnikishii (nom. ined.)]|nr:hypothetical protein H2203_000338 [Dothideales sp. JES 119]